MRVTGIREGFRLAGFDGSERVLAHARLPAPRVSKYGVDVAALDSAAAVLLDPDAAEVFLVDEIGRMECLSARFIAEVKRRPDVTPWEVTRANRDARPHRDRRVDRSAYRDGPRTRRRSR
jgi:nucleoside-triphosphatase